MFWQKYAVCLTVVTNLTLSNHNFTETALRVQLPFLPRKEVQGAMNEEFRPSGGKTARRLPQGILPS